MALLQTSGPISMYDICDAFEVSRSTPLQSFYRSGSIVPNTETNSNIPYAAPAEISLEHFYGAGKDSAAHIRYGGGGSLSATADNYAGTVTLNGLHFNYGLSPQMGGAVLSSNPSYAFQNSSRFRIHFPGSRSKSYFNFIQGQDYPSSEGRLYAADASHGTLTDSSGNTHTYWEWSGSNFEFIFYAWQDGDGDFDACWINAPT